MWAMMILMTTLCAADIAGITPGFGDSVHSLYSCSVLDLLLVQVIGLDVGSIAFFRVLEVVLA